MKFTHIFILKVKVYCCHSLQFRSLFSVQIGNSLEHFESDITLLRDNVSSLVVMGQHLINVEFSESGANVDIPLRNTNKEGEKSNKCNQCDYAPSQASNLRTHLKTHSALVEKSQTNATNVILHHLGQAI